MNQARSKKPFQILFQIFILFLPPLEIYRSFFGDTLQILGFAAEEVLCLCTVFVLFFAGIVFAVKEKKYKALLFLFLVAIVLSVYTLLHAQNAARFRADLLPLGKPDFLREAYYTARMYLAPLTLISSAYFLSLPSEKLFSSLRISLFLFSIGIILPCLFGVSFASYEEGNTLVAGGFFSWFSLSETSDFAAHTAKGFFSHANDIGGILFALTPFAAHTAVRRGKIRDFLLLFCAGLASIMLGTKIAAFGFFLALGAFLIYRAIDIFYRKKAKSAWHNLSLAGLIFLILIPLLLLSPGFRLQIQREEQKAAARPLTNVEIIERLAQKANGDFDSLSREDILTLDHYLEENAWEHYIDPWFPELYPAASDPGFWIEILLRDGAENRDARAFKIEMCRHIREQNANENDSLLGMGFTSGIPYAERDFLFQYYQFGLLGTVLLLLPFFALFVFALIRALLCFVNKRDSGKEVTFALAQFCFFVAAWFAGHVFDTFLPTYFLVLISAGILLPRNKTI